MTSFRSRLLCLPAILACLASCSLLSFAPEPPNPFPQLNNVAWKKKNVIVVLGMRTELSGERVVLPAIAVPRVLETARLYRECRKTSSVCLILATGGDPADNGLSEAAVIRRDLIELKVPKKDIRIEEKSESTKENAEFCRPILQRESPDVMVLVTSQPHLARALNNFKELGMVPLPAPAEVPPRRSN